MMPDVQQVFIQIMVETFENSQLYTVSPTYRFFTTVDPTTAIFGLCTHKWGIFALVGDPLQSH